MPSMSESKLLEKLIRKRDRIFTHGSKKEIQEMGLSLVRDIRRLRKMILGA